MTRVKIILDFVLVGITIEPMKPVTMIHHEHTHKLI
jgi:hypothetical protein